jgi:hypothetical protein
MLTVYLDLDDDVPGGNDEGVHEEEEREDNALLRA